MYIQRINFMTRQAEHRSLHKHVRSVVIVHIHTCFHTYIIASSLKVVLICTHRLFDACIRVYCNTAHYVSGTRSATVFRLASSKTNCPRNLVYYIAIDATEKSRKSISSNVTHHRHDPIE